MFDLAPNTVHSVVSKMMITGGIHASWDDTSQCILVNQQEPRHLQKIAIKLSERICSVIEQIELTVNMKNPKFAIQDRRISDRGNKVTPKKDDRINFANSVLKSANRRSDRIKHTSHVHIPRFDDSPSLFSI